MKVVGMRFSCRQQSFAQYSNGVIGPMVNSMRELQDLYDIDVSEIMQQPTLAYRI
jgi:hypothetical protein